MSKAERKTSASRFLNLLFTYLPEDETYTADAGDWATAIQRLQRDHEDEYPGLFEGLTIRDHPDAGPHSPDVSEFLTLLQYGDLVEVMNPRFTRLKIKSEAAQRLQDEYEERTDSETLEIVEELADDLVEESRGILFVEE